MEQPEVIAELLARMDAIGKPAKSDPKNSFNQWQTAAWLLRAHFARVEKVIETGLEWRAAREALSKEHPRTLATNRRVTTAQFAHDDALAEYSRLTSPSVK